MKKVLNYIISFFICFNPSLIEAAEIILPEDDDVAYWEEQENQKDPEYNFQDQVIILSRYFNNNYEGDKIDDDLSEDVKRFFPSLSQQGVYDAEKWIRRGVKTYRWGVDFYDKFMNSLMTPPVDTILPEEDYDLPQERKYIETENPDEYIVITDIKKVLSYGKNPQDKELMQAKLDFDAGRKKVSPLEEFKKIKRLWLEGKYRKLLSDGWEEEKEKNDGLGEADDKGVVSGSLVANLRGIAKPERLKFGLYLKIPQGRFVSAENSGKYFAPIVNLEESENIESYNVYRPVPLRFNHSGGESLGVYTGVTLLPIDVKISEYDKPLHLKAKSLVNVCDYTLECQEVELNTELELSYFDNYPSEVDSFIEQSFNHLPQKKDKKLSLQKVVIDTDDEDRDYVRLEFSYKGSSSKFDVFIEDDQKNSYIAPYVSFNEDKIFVRFQPLDENKKFNIAKMRVVAVLGNGHALESVAEPKRSSLFDPQGMTFSFGIILWAFLGGLILNFMPCVFPVLSVKIIALSRLDGKSSGEIKRSIKLSIFGIFCGFAMLASFLSVLKVAGVSLGWGIQFQNHFFLGIMMLIIALFWAQLKGFVEFKTPEFMNRYLSKNAKENDFISIMTGIFVVLMSTPCSAPFLGAAVGFALSGTIYQLYLIFAALALGLSFPYFMMLLPRNVLVYMPKEQIWQKRFLMVMKLMLWLTFLWLASILAAQISMKKVFIFTGFVAVIIFLLWLKEKLLAAMQNDDQITQNKEELIVGAQRFFRIVAAAVVFFSLLYLNFAHKDAEAANPDLESVTKIDFEEIKKNVTEGKIVVLEIGANWCLTCKLNEITAINWLKENAEKNNIKYIKVDWSEYDKDILEFMAKYGRRGLPFYVVYTQALPDGIVLPEIINIGDLERITEALLH